MRPGRERITLRKALFPAVYGAVFASLVLLLAVGTPEASDAPQGSLEGRFDSAVTLAFEGKVWHYREAEITNYLLIGVDGGMDQPESVQADFLLLLSVDRRAQCITPIMVDRDTAAWVTTYGVFGQASGQREMQISLAQAFHASGSTGSANTVQALSRLLFGAPIDHYLAVDIGGIAQINDALGGVVVTVEDDLTALDASLVPGSTVRLSGAQAEAFVRGRMTVGDGTNASRMRRQRVYLEGMLDALQDGQVQEGVLRQALEGHCETDMTEAALWSALKRYEGYKWAEIVTLPGWYDTDEADFTRFRLDEEGTAAILTGLWFR